jgi:hypothetical protein
MFARIQKSLKQKGQIAIEFLLLTAFGFIMLFVMLIVLNNISLSNQNNQRIRELSNLGESVQSEIITANEMENGYHRTLNLPSRLKGGAYSLIINDSSDSDSYLQVNSGAIEIIYAIPKTTGSIAPGNNIIVKDGTLSVMHTG